MDANDIIKATQSTQPLVQEEHYYKHIFKKTEKIVSVIFYIAQNTPENKRYDFYIKDMLDTAQATHEASLATLRLRVHVAEDALRELVHMLISLESKLQIAKVSGVIAPEVIDVLHNEIDSVLRNLSGYLKQSGALEDLFHQPAVTGSGAKKITNTGTSAKKNEQDGTKANLKDNNDRKGQIVAVLEATSEASIKDIADVITDCSEKTIQRDLNQMIEEGTVVRHGERRWSRYALA